ncbi:hypothetical protein PVAG01_01116 [Phlyctema vagabunda]|uniref:Nuclear pore protein n=1 Tax=Phlyctema vagabunda TaxID=108571 RepID=A0ABR4PW72_9HELO
MSLFGSTQSKPSLFSGTAAPSGGGLFGNPTQSTQQGGTSAFGNLGGNSTAQSGGFGASNPAPAQGSSFGGAQQAQNNLFGGAKPAAQSSLFGGPQQTQNSLFGGAQTQQSGGLFGAAAPASQPQGGLFAAAQNSIPPTSLFDQYNASQQQQGSLSQSQATSQQSGAYFDAILEKSRKRAHVENADEDLPSLQLGLGDLRQRIKKLGAGVPEQRDDGRAHYLLAASGVDPGAAVRDLNLFNAQSTRAERPQRVDTPDTDVEGYLANLQAQTTISMIEDGLARSVRDFDSFLEDNVAMEWDAQRKRIYQHFGIKPREDLINTRANASFAASSSGTQSGFGRSRRTKGAALNGSRAAGTPGASAFGRSGLSKSIIGAAGPIGSGRQALFADVEKRLEAKNANLTGPNDRFEREKQSKFIEKVQELNIARLNKSFWPVISQFSKVADPAAEPLSSDILRAYRGLKEIVGENSDVQSLAEPTAVRERQFAEAYLDEAPNSAQSITIKNMILTGATRFLEQDFYENLEALVSRNPREANLGGVPNVLSKVKAYVRIQAARKNLISEQADLQMLGDDHAWALIYFLIRSGHVREAVEYVSSNAVAFRSIDRNFSTYITAYYNSPDRRLRRDLQDRISNEYNQRLRVAPENSIDPFRMLCYKVIGRCDLESRNLHGVPIDMEDYMWLQFVLAREVSRVDEIANEVYGLAEVQAHIHVIGQRHFKVGADGANSTAYFMILILGGLFEQAIDYLYPFQHIDAVHFAIVLDYYGLLRVSDPAVAESDFMSRTTKGQPQISFAFMLGYYTREFRAANVAAAVDYLSLICLNQDLPGEAGRTQVSMCHESMRELILESREFAMLLGDIRADGQRIQGAIEERLSLIALQDADEFMRTVTIQAASVADDNGRTTDAVLLYHLAGEFDNVIVIITRALSEAIAVPIGQDPMRLQPLKPRALELEQAQGNSLSLTSVDDPVVLARDMTSLYGQNRMYLNKIKDANKDACGVLLRMSEAKALVERERWPEAMDIIIALDILPLRANGNASEVRRYGTKFSSLPQTVANNVPNLLMWTILCCNKQRAILSAGQFGGNDGTRRQMIEDLKQKNMDLTTYTSQLRYRFPAHLHEALARAVSE